MRKHGYEGRHCYLSEVTDLMTVLDKLDPMAANVANGKVTYAKMYKDSVCTSTARVKLGKTEIHDLITCMPHSGCFLHALLYAMNGQMLGDLETLYNTYMLMFPEGMP